MLAKATKATGTISTKAGIQAKRTKIRTKRPKPPHKAVARSISILFLITVPSRRCDPTMAVATPEKPCPPGLAKKYNGCLPPGQAKKYNRGDVVPESVTLYRIPGALEVKLKPLPAGYVYRYVDGEVLVVAEAARKVIDAVVLLSTL